MNNSLLITTVFKALFRVVGRRTLDSFAVQILKTTVEKLEKKFDFLNLIVIHDEVFSEDGIKATIDPTFDTIEPSQLGVAIDALLRVIYLELTETIGHDASLYFIKEIKEHLGDTAVDELNGLGVNFEQIQAEHHKRYQMKGPQIPPASYPKKEEQKEQMYTWENVSIWKYDNNVCLLYDEEGRLLDTLQLDLIIEDYVERVTESREHHLVSAPKTTMLKITEKENKLLEMIQRRDIDIDSAVSLLHVSRQKFDSMIQKLLKLEMLQYISDNELQLTEKGLTHLSGFKKV